MNPFAKNTLYTFVTLVTLFASTISFAQSTLVLCVDKSTQKVTAKSSCSSSETLVSGKNLTNTGNAVTGVDFTACYTTSAKRSGSTADGRLGVGVLCRQKSDFLMNDQVITSANSTARPAIERKKLTMAGKVPNGVEYGLIATGAQKGFYEVQVTALCCPASTR